MIRNSNRSWKLCSNNFVVQLISLLRFFFEREMLLDEFLFYVRRAYGPFYGPHGEPFLISCGNENLTIH